MRVSAREEHFEWWNLSSATSIGRGSTPAASLASYCTTAASGTSRPWSSASLVGPAASVPASTASSVCPVASGTSALAYTASLVGPAAAASLNQEQHHRQQLRPLPPQQHLVRNKAEDDNKVGVTEWPLSFLRMNSGSSSGIRDWRTLSQTRDWLWPTAVMMSGWSNTNVRS